MKSPIKDFQDHPTGKNVDFTLYNQNRLVDA
jgi:hypothetical protein